MKTKVFTLLIGIFLALFINGYAAGKLDSTYDKISGIIANKLAIRQLENEQLRQQGKAGNFIVYITDEDLVKSRAFPDFVFSLPQNKTYEYDIEKLWDFQKKPLEGVAEKLQNFSNEQGFDYYLVICAIYNYYRLDENTDFSNIRWTNSDILISKGGPSLFNNSSGNVENTGGYSNLLRYLQKKFANSGKMVQTGIARPHLYHFVMTTYFPFANGTDTKPVGRLRHFQGLTWSSPNGDPIYDEVWKTFYTSQRNELAGAAKPGNKGKSKEEWLDKFVTVNQAVLAGIRNTHPEELMAITDKNAMLKKLEDIPDPVFAGYSSELRIHILQVLSSEQMRDETESKVCGLIEQTPASQADAVIQAMRLVNPRVPDKVYIVMDPANGTGSFQPNYKSGWCLVKCLTDETNDKTLGLVGSDNYHRLIKALSKLSCHSPSFRKEAQALNDSYLNSKADNIPDRVIFYTYNSFWNKIVTTFAYNRYAPTPRIDFSTDYTETCGLVTKKQLFLSYCIPNLEIQKIQLDPFTPIVFRNKSDLGLLTDIAKNTEAPVDHIVPAIVLKYADEKGTNETISDVTMAAFDVASMATGYGELQAGIKGVRKAWVLFDMINAGVNITLNVAAYNNNPTLKEIIKYYNLATGAVTLTRLATSAVKNVRNLYTALKATPEAMDASSINDLLAAVKGAGDDLAKLEKGDVDKIKKFLARLKAEAKARQMSTFEEKVDEALDALKKADKAAETATGIFKVFTKSQLESLEPSINKAVTKIKERGTQAKYTDVSKTDDALWQINEGNLFTVGDLVEAPAKDFLLRSLKADEEIFLTVQIKCYDAAGNPVGGSLREIDVLHFNKSANVIEKGTTIKLEPRKITTGASADRKSLSYISQVPDNGSQLRNFVTNFVAENPKFKLGADRIAEIDRAEITFVELGSKIKRELPPSEFNKYLGSAKDFSGFKVDGISPETLGTTKQELLEGALELIRKKLLQ
jgi:hypothetical protein